MPIFIGTKKATKLFVGTKEVDKIFVGTDLVYTRTHVSNELVIYDSSNLSNLSLVDNDTYYDAQYCPTGFPASINDKRYHWMPPEESDGTELFVPRPNYKLSGKWDMSNVPTTGKLRLYIDGDSGQSDIQHNAYFFAWSVGTGALPSTATAMHVTVDRGANSCYLQFGMLPDDATNSMSTSNGGILSELLSPTINTGTYTLQIPSGTNLSSWYPIINIRGSGKRYAQLDIMKVWFTI